MMLYSSVSDLENTLDVVVRPVTNAYKVKDLALKM